jgi:hypothetical protein
MKKIEIQILYHTYVNLYQLLKGIEAILLKKGVKLSGTKCIPYDLVTVNMLKNRYLFRYEPTKMYYGYPITKWFAFEIFEAQAICYSLDDVSDLPLNVRDFHQEMKSALRSYVYEPPKTEFQIWYEKITENIENAMTYTEIRDEYPKLYKLYLEDYEEEKAIGNQC